MLYISHTFSLFVKFLVYYSLHGIYQQISDLFAVIVQVSNDLIEYLLKLKLIWTFFTTLAMSKLIVLSCIC